MTQDVFIETKYEVQSTKKNKLIKSGLIEGHGKELAFDRYHKKYGNAALFKVQLIYHRQRGWA